MLKKEDLALEVQNLSEVEIGIKLNKGQSEATVDLVLDSIKKLSKQDKLRLFGFGDFETVVKPARKGRNPQDGSPIEIPEKNAPKFKPAKGFKDYVNN